ncbi:hypothetical protein AB0F15_38025 [Amycolatopsis sp. NPDC026612]|uniref:hypothetical protein n=1 Tax=Amycolatopsis sp. NPDC026612 TaxID=3155466 RepID=UPI0033DC64D3
MAAIVGVHGIGQQYRGESTMHKDWLPALQDGVRRAGVSIEPDDLRCAFYGDLFRGEARVLSGDMPQYTAEDLEEGVEFDLLELWWEGAAATDEGVVGPDARTLARTPRSAQRALNALAGSRFFAGLAERVMISSLKQVRKYLTDAELRERVISKVAEAVASDTRVLIGHSLGSIVAYEALCAHPEWPVTTFVTVGSPLGIRNLIFDRLRPAPSSGIGHWPGSVEGWANVADEGDVVALVKDLRPVFGPNVRCMVVDCGARAHDVTRYLTSDAVGEAVAAGLPHG